MANVADLEKRKEEIVFTKKNPSVGLDVVAGKIMKVYPHSEFLGILFTSDIIDSVNGQKVNNTMEMIKAVHARCPGKTTIEFRRDEHCSAHMKPILPPKRPGFDLLECTLMWRTGGTPVGLLIHRDFSGAVMVAMVESGSAASKAIRAGDQLLKVNGKDVTDRDQARKLIMESINQFRRVVMILERCSSGTAPPSVPPTATNPPATVTSTMLPSINQTPVAPNTKDDYTPTVAMAPPIPATPAPTTSVVASVVVVNATVNKTIDCLLPKDVLDIMEENKNFFKAKCGLPPCLKMTKEPVQPIHIDLPNGAEESVIPFDPSPKPLKATPKRVGS